MNYEQLIQSLRDQGWTDQDIAQLSQANGDPEHFTNIIRYINGTKGLPIPPPYQGNVPVTPAPQTPMPEPTAPAPTPAPAPTVPTPPSGVDQSARAIIEGTLAQYGLGSLGTFAWNAYLSGAPISQILLDIRQTPEYKARFPAMSSLAAQGQAISEAAYIEYERNATSLMRSYGLPEGFYDQPDDFTGFLTNQVALPELKARLDEYQTAVYQAPAETRQMLQQYYGLSPGQILAAFIDPDKALPIIEKEVGAAQVGGAAVRTGFGGITKEQAESLLALGLSPEVYAQGFTQLGSQSQIFGGLPGWNQGQIGVETQLAAQFAGNVTAQQEIEKRQLDLLAPFKEGGGVATTQRGAVGAGVAR